MKAKELSDRSSEELETLRADLRKELFQFRMKNFTNQLENTSLIGKARKDLARIETVLLGRKAAEGSQA